MSGVPNVAAMLENLSLTVPDLMRLVTAFGYVAGMYLIFKGLLELKKYGESRTMMSQHHELKIPLGFIIAGTLLLYLPSTVYTGTQTVFAETNPIAYTPDQTNDWTNVIQAAYLVIQFLGTIAFIRGLIILSNLGHAQQGTVGKGFAHILGGILCINLYQFVQIIKGTLMV